MLRKAYDWMMRLAASRHAELWLALAAFAEGLFFPVPPDVMLMPMVLARRERAWRYAAVCLIASVCGGSTGYAVGHFLAPLGHWLLSLTGGDPVQLQHWFSQWGVVLLALPIPYKLTAIASGLFHLMNFPMFVGASLAIRGLRFFLVAGLVRTYGAPIREFVEKRLALVVSAVALLAIGLFVAIRFIH